ncbi:MAG: FctA domain-containing protein [Christensenella sp.]|nr:FctA domain-containing protein [Christensenella sp.]
MKQIHRTLAGLLLLAIALVVPAGNLALADTPATLSIPVYKVVSGIPATTETFTFRLTGLDSAPMPAGSVNGVKSATIAGTGNTTFGTITYTAVGDFRYTISEVAGTSGNYAYDSTVYDLTVQVTWKDQAGGVLQAAMYLVRHGQTEKQERAQFTNTVQADYVIVDPPVEKRISGDRPSTNSTFVFYLKADNTANPMPEGSADGLKSITINGTGSVDFGNITYTRAGTYTYTVYEKVGSASGYVYDATVYHMTVVVTESNGKLSATRTITNSSGVAQTGVVFTNAYDKPDGPKTGDESKAYLWWILIAMGLICLVAAFLPGKKNKK